MQVQKAHALTPVPVLVLAAEAAEAARSTLLLKTTLKKSCLTRIRKGALH